MSQRAVDYVLGLGPDRVTFSQKAALVPIANAYSDRYESANVDLDSLCAALFRSRGHLARVYKSLDHIIEYKPGLGSGNFSQFRFIELDAEKAAERQHKGSIFEIAIRKDLNPNQNQNPPSPPFSKGGSSASLSDHELSLIRRRFNSLVRNARRRPSEGLGSSGPTYEELAREACKLAVIDPDRAMPVIMAIWGESKTKKEPQRATA